MIAHKAHCQKMVLQAGGTPEEDEEAMSLTDMLIANGAKIYEE